MKSLLPIVIALIIPLFFILLGSMSCHHRLATLRNRFRNAFASFEAQIKLRHELILSLVESAKAALGREDGVLDGVLAARSSAAGALARAAASPGDGAAMKELAGAETALSGALARFFALTEANPELKASASVTGLMEALSSRQDEVAFARQAHNDAVMAYNATRESFPTIVIASLFHFARAELFAAEDQQQREGTGRSNA